MFSIESKMAMEPTADQFAGCLFGLAIGDALGAPVEGLGGDLIHSMGPASELVKNPSGGTLFYTDDTQMMIGVAETLHRKFVGVQKYKAELAGETTDRPKHRWYQFSLLEMLLITTIVAAILGIGKLVELEGLWLALDIAYAAGISLLIAFAKWRRYYIQYDMWYDEQ